MLSVLGRVQSLTKLASPCHSVCIFIFFFSLFAGTSAHGQERCATSVMEKKKSVSIGINRQQIFEEWMGHLQQQPRKKLVNRTQNDPYVIPVVVHVIHNGEPVGTGTNLSDEQIQSQIDVLNQDFQRLNPDVDQTPDLFQPVASSMNIQFVLARQDPDGLPTNGILRVHGGSSGWTISDESTFKALSYWRADQYLNIWVVRFTDSFIGFAQLPLPGDTSLPGLEQASADSLTDGVAVDYTAFGSVLAGSFDLDPQFNRGRTATHEIAHYFGLRHIWGDGSSCTTDYVEDTPPQSSATRGCPAHPRLSCGGTQMFQNFMDYTDDECMNLFTQGQVGRMDIVINNSPRRKSLLTSPGATDPSGNLPVTDLALDRVLRPGPVVCVRSVTPSLQVRNSGNTVINNFEIQYTVNNGTPQSRQISNLQLNPGDAINVEVSSTDLQAGTNVIIFDVRNPNGTSDQLISNNSISYTVVVNSAQDIIPLRQNFDQTFSEWSIVSQNGRPQWQTSSTNFNTSLVFNSFTNPARGQQTWLVSPVLNLTSPNEASVLFYTSYAIRGQAREQFRVLASDNCGIDYNVTLLSLSGDELANSTSSAAWTPVVASEWTRQYVNLNSLLGQSQVRVAWVATNQNGNNLYLDNIEFFTSDDVNPPLVSEPYQIYGTSSAFNDYAITFNLQQRQQEVLVALYNLQGQRVSEHRFNNVLNQTFPLDLSESASGLYIVRVNIEGSFSATKIFVAR
jgi:hypothetical protein